MPALQPNCEGGLDGLAGEVVQGCETIGECAKGFTDTLLVEVLFGLMSVGNVS